MTELSIEEQRYLLAAFAESKHDWFPPRLLGKRDFSEQESDRLVEALVRRGMMEAQPQRHARLTDRGRREATELGKASWGQKRTSRNRRRAGVEIAVALIAVALLFFVLKWGGLF